MKKRKEMFDFVLTSIFAAIIMLLSLIPNLGYITFFPGVSITIVHIPVIIGVFILSWKNSLVLGFFFGLSSLIASYLYGAAAFDLAFRNPLVSILPRMLFAVSAFYIARMFAKLFELKKGKFILFGLISVITILVTVIGLNSMFKKIIYNPSDKLAFEVSVIDSEIKKLESLENITIDQQEKLDELIEKLAIETNKYEEELISDNYRYDNLKIFIFVSIIVISIGLVIVYYITIVIKNSKYANIPSVLVLSTIVHTLLVIGTVGLLKPQTFYETFNSTNIVSAIFLFVLVNGFIEALLSAVIGTPIAVAMSKRLGEEE